MYEDEDEDACISLPSVLHWVGRMCLTVNAKKILERWVKAFSFYSRVLRLWSLKRWSLFLEVLQDQQIHVNMTSSMELSPNVLHMKKDISETIFAVNCLNICHVAIKFLIFLQWMFNAQISAVFKLFGEYSKGWRIHPAISYLLRLILQLRLWQPDCWGACIWRVVTDYGDLSRTSVDTYHSFLWGSNLPWVVLHPAISRTNGQITYPTSASHIIVKMEIS